MNSDLHHLWTSTGAILGAAGILVGAYTMHKVRRGPVSNITLEEERETQLRVTWCQTAIQMQMIHSLSLILLNKTLTSQTSNRAVNITGSLTLAGIALFSGSLYIKALSPNGKYILNRVTPAGGYCFLFSWLSRLFH